ncbi:hypothetical protein CSE45_0349 [Citreicella sp. SE45]|jgi:hypothetical protein|nr:hypothetical protein CSE45_0349 [Citreicella sp. SE45]
MTFRSRVLWLSGLIALAASFGLLPRGEVSGPISSPVPKAVAFRL